MSYKTNTVNYDLFMRIIMRQASKHITRGSVLLAIAVYSATIQTPVYSSTTTSTVTANIISTISLTNQSGLIFGDISSGASAGTIIISTSGTRTQTGGASFNSGSTAGPASFNVAGDANATYSVTLPASVTLSSGAGSSMTVDNFTSSPSGTGQLDVSGNQALLVGATLNVGSNQIFGSYSGIMSVTVGYN